VAVELSESACGVMCLKPELENILKILLTILQEAPSISLDEPYMKIRLVFKT